MKNKVTWALVLALLVIGWSGYVVLLVLIPHFYTKYGTYVTFGYVLGAVLLVVTTFFTVVVRRVQNQTLKPTA